MKLTSITRVSRALATLVLLSTATSCARSSGAGAFLVLEPRFMKKELPPSMSPPPADTGATDRVDSIRLMRVAEGERKVEALAMAAAATVRTYPESDFRTTWHEAGDGGESRLLAMNVPLGRAVVPTGYDVISPYWGNVFWLNN